MATIHLPPDFIEFFRLLNANQVEYLLVGGYAVAYHGYPRATGDLDIRVATDRRNSERLMVVLEQFGFAAPGPTPDLLMEPGRVIRMGVPPVRIEIQTGVSGVRFEDCYARKVVGTLDGVGVQIIGLDDLKRNKRAAGRHKDLSDIENLP